MTGSTYTYAGFVKYKRLIGKKGDNTDSTNEKVFYKLVL